MNSLRIILMAAFSQSMVFSSAQNVGIGMSSPLSKLHIKGSTNVSQLCIDANSIQGNTMPLIKLRNNIGKDLMWIHADDSTNVFIGVRAGSANIIGINGEGTVNTAIGSDALGFNTTGYANTAYGTSALFVNTEGNENTAVGVAALANSTGSSNTAIGYLAGNELESGSNNVLIGYNAQVPNASGGSNQIRFGNQNITYAGIQIAWTITSDRRWKSDIQDSNLGLDFISKLKPVSYYRTNDESKKREYGFIAQDLEEALNASGATDNGIISKDDNGWYGVRYNDLMTPMVKAIQEQQTIIENQSRLINDLMNRIETLENKE